MEENDNNLCIFAYLANTEMYSFGQSSNDVYSLQINTCFIRKHNLWQVWINEKLFSDTVYLYEYFCMNWNK